LTTGAQWCVDVKNVTDFSVKQFCVVVCVCVRNDLYCVEWGVKLYSLTHPVVYVYHHMTLYFFRINAVVVIIF